MKLLFGSKGGDPMLNKVGLNLANYDAATSVVSMQRKAA